MRRREKPADHGAPLPLVRYRAEDWPGACHSECAFWQAREQWAGTHPADDLPLEGIAPDAPFHPESV